MIQESKQREIKVGDTVEVKIIDELPDGDGSCLFDGTDEVIRIQNDGNLVLSETGLIALPSEVIRIVKSKIKNNERY